MATKLKQMVIKELSLVDYGANVDSKITICKSMGTSYNPSADKEFKMSEDQVAKLNTQIAELTKQLGEVAVLKSKLSDAEMKASMTDEEKEHFNGLPEAEKKSFMAMDPEARKKSVKKRAIDDETVTIDGTVIKKSAIGSDMFAVIKSQQAALQAQREEVLKAAALVEMSELKKRADDEYKHLPGTVEAKAAILKGAKSMSAEASAALEAILKAAEKMAAEAYSTKGAKNGKTGDSGVNKSAASELEELAKEVAKNDKISYEKAYSQVIEKRSDLYTKFLSELAS